VDVDLMKPELYAHGVPHELFTEMRRAGPVHRNPKTDVAKCDEQLSFWNIVTHDEIQHANRDWQTFSAVDGPGIAPSDQLRRGRMIVSMDPTPHTRVRRLISAGFTPRMIAELEAMLVRRTAQILDEVADRGECDFVADVAYQLPMHVIADIVGIPEADRAWVFARTDLVLRAQAPALGLDPKLGWEAQVELFAYAQALANDKRQHPGDDVWTTLTQATIDDEDGTPTSLAEFELDMFFLVLALAGSETTRNAISQGLMALVEHPDQLEALRLDPGLFPSATEEILRWASPVLYFGRTATADTELGGARIAAGDRVVLWYPSGNRDETAFADPFRFDIRRTPNPHVSFGGGGPHYCLGANLAKKEVAVMFGALLDRFAAIEITGDPEWLAAGPAHNVGVSVDRLPVRVTPKRATN
jgi:cytochrome P450